MFVQAIRSLLKSDASSYLISKDPKYVIGYCLAKAFAFSELLFYTAREFGERIDRGEKFKSHRTHSGWKIADGGNVACRFDRPRAVPAVLCVHG